MLRFPTLIACGFAAVASLVFFVAGLILDTLIHKDQQTFEFRLVLIDNLFKEKVGNQNED